jgi:pimeloyl-ACP methyl ester carboxylesterase
LWRRRDEVWFAGVGRITSSPVDAPPNQLRGLSEDSGYLANYLKNISGPVVLVGHSYGGAVITDGATGNPNVKALVYVDAFIPAANQSLGQLLSPQSCLAGAGVDPTKVFQFVQDPALPKGDLDAYALTQPTSLYPGFQQCFAEGFPSWQASELAAAQRPIALGAITDPSGPPAWASIPSWALVGTQDQAIPEASQVAMATTAGSHISYFRAPHFGLVDQPWKVAAVINHAVAATS